MTDIFDEDDDSLEPEAFVSVDEERVEQLEAIENKTMDARRRLEYMLEERRLREELEDDFTEF